MDGTTWLPRVAVRIAGIMSQQGRWLLFDYDDKTLSVPDAAAWPDRATKLANRLRWVKLRAFLRL